MTSDPVANAEAGPSASSPTRLTPGASPYYESSQFKHWRFSRTQIAAMRDALNKKSVEVVARNQELEKIALKHTPSETIPSTAYLSVSDELLLLRFYCIQIATICRKAFGLPEVVEATAISYMKRFYLKNSVMEWHPKAIMPTCLFFAAKTTNYPVLIDQFIPKFSKLTAADVLDTEFLLAQSLSFEFWVRGAEKALRGWYLEFQEDSSIDISLLTNTLPLALKALEKSRLTDIEFIYTPSQIGLACWRLSAPSLVSGFLDWRYDTMPESYGMDREALESILDEIQGEIASVKDVEGDVAKGLDMKEVKGVDKRLRMCSNPEKTPGTALYLKRKREQDAQEASARAAKSLKASQAMSDRDNVFGATIMPPLTSTSASTPKSSTPKLESADPFGAKLASSNASLHRTPLSPAITNTPFSPRTSLAGAGAGAAPTSSSTATPKSGLPIQSSIRKDENARAGIHGIEGDGPGKGDVGVMIGEETGMGVRDDGPGRIRGGSGLKEVGKSLEDAD